MLIDIDMYMIENDEFEYMCLKILMIQTDRLGKYYRNHARFARWTVKENFNILF